VNKYSLTKEYILSQPFQEVELGMCGVYFIIKDEEVIYIGQSVLLWERVRAHRHMKYDRYFFIECDEKELNYLESKYITQFCPDANIQFNPAKTKKWARFLKVKIDDLAKSEKGN
jgi:excinuclease UvrABC nuclease subunit